MGWICEGHAALFNRQSRNLGGFVEWLNPGCFTWGKVEANINHYGVICDTYGGLSIWQDRAGLRFSFHLSPGLACDRLVWHHRNGMVIKCSFSFQRLPGGDHWQPAVNAWELPRRIITAARLIAVTLLLDETRPAYDGPRAWLVETAGDQARRPVGSIQRIPDFDLHRRRLRIAELALA